MKHFRQMGVLVITLALMMAPAMASACEGSEHKANVKQAAHIEKKMRYHQRGWSAKGVYPQWPGEPEINALVQQAVEPLLKPDPSEDNTAEMDKLAVEVDYKIITETPELVSILFGVTWFAEGAAHPNHYSQTLNLIRKEHRPLRVTELFLPQRDWVHTASVESHKLLEEQLGPDSLFEEGLTHKSANFKNWNLTKEGLRITFDPYQVAAYAAGSPTVVIPYQAFGDVNPNLPKWLALPAACE